MPFSGAAITPTGSITAAPKEADSNPAAAAIVLGASVLSGSVFATSELSDAGIAAAPNADFRRFLGEGASAETSFFDLEDLEARGLFVASVAATFFSLTTASFALLFVFFEFEALRDCILLILLASQRKCHYLFRWTSY